MKREAGADDTAEGECELLASDKRIHLTTEQGAQGTIPDELHTLNNTPSTTTAQIWKGRGRAVTGKAAAQRSRRGQMTPEAAVTSAPGGWGKTARPPTAKTVSNEMHWVHDVSAALPRTSQPPSLGLLVQALIEVFLRHRFSA